MRNKLNYVAAGAEGLFSKEGEWVFDLKAMPIDYYLINASTFIGKKGVETAVKQKEQANALGKTILCDSGGFQLATEVIDYIDPQGVIDVQNRVADIGFILDVPTMKRTTTAGAAGLELDASEGYFSTCLEKTVQNLRKAKDIKRNFKYYGIAQGVSYNQLKRWWETIEKEDTFAGIGTKGVILEQVLNGLFFTESTGVLSHHILGLGAAPRLLLVRYFYFHSKKDMNCITYDNTNHIQYSKYMQMVLPFCSPSYGKSLNINDFEELSGVRLLNKEPDEIFFAGIKNLYYYGMLNRFINMLDTAEVIRDFVKSNMKGMLPYIQCIDDYFEHGIQYVMKNYPDLGDGPQEKKQTASILSFAKG